MENTARDRLENLREKLQISQCEAQLIEREVFAPLQQKQKNLKRYEKALKEVLAEEGSLDRNTIEELKRDRQQLELQDEDIEAIADHTEAISLNPKYAKAYNNRGNVYRNLKEYQKAIADFKKAADLYQQQENYWR